MATNWLLQSDLLRFACVTELGCVINSEYNDFLLGNSLLQLLYKHVF